MTGFFFNSLAVPYENSRSFFFSNYVIIIKAKLSNEIMYSNETRASELFLRLRNVKNSK